jgi:ribosomal protein S12 methylthiotransferase accessory factor
VQFLRLAYGSNGMCAGNTPEEAVVQGISEVLERHVNLEILKKQIVPPTIPAEYIAGHLPQLAAIIEEIEQKSGFKLTFKDCSLGQGSCHRAVCHRPATQRYLLSSGAHPAPGSRWKGA